MAGTSRMGWAFTAGLLVGGALALVVFWVAARLPSQHEALTASEELHAPSRQQEKEQPQTAGQKGRSVAPRVASSTAAPPALACGYDPLVVPSGPGDGQFGVDAALALRQKPSPAAFAAVAKEAAEEQRPRDTEVALMVACRLAASASSVPTVALADIQTRLGQHYFDSASGEGFIEARAELLERAHELLADSLSAYTAALGPNASKTRLAGRRLAALAAASSPMDSVAEGNPRTPPPEGLLALGAAMRPPAYDVRPGCGNMPSVSLAIICSDPEFAQLDSNLRRLRAQAASVTSDPDGFRRRSEQAQARRDSSCRDKACLLRWYAQRRRELIEEF